MFTRKLRNYFLTGLFAILPVIVTGYILVWGFTWADGFMGGFVEKVFHRPIQGLGLLITLFLVTGLGLITKNFLGRRLMDFLEKIILQIPLAGNIYGTTKQITEAVTSPDKAFFRSVVMVEYPRLGMLSPGFMVGEAPNAAGRGAGPDRLVTVFIPTAPNPATGFLVFIPEDQVTPIDMSVEDGLKFFLSLGVVHSSRKQNGSVGKEGGETGSPCLRDQTPDIQEN